MEGLKKGPWSKEEDAILLDWVAAHGPHYWSCIQSKGLLMRTGKSCRLRWVNKLRPGLKKGRGDGGTTSHFGNKWARIAEFFPGRTDNDVKNLWSTRKKRLARNYWSPLPSISKSGTGVYGPEQAVPPNETPADDLQQDKAITSDHQETIGLPQCFDPTSATPVLTGPTSKPPNTKTALSLAPFDDLIPHQQCLNGTSMTPVLTLPTNNPPNTKSETSSVPFDSITQHQQHLHATSGIHVLTLPTIKPPDTKSVPSSAPFDNVMPHQKCLNCASVTAVLTVPSIKSEPSSAPFSNTTLQIQSPPFDRHFENELVFFESDISFLGCSGAYCTPPTFDDLTADVLASF